MKQRILRHSATLITLCLLATGCIQVKNIEKAWNAAKPDEELVGTWEDKNQGMVSFAKTDRDMLVTSGTNGLEGGCRSIETNGHKYAIVASFKAALLGFGKMDADAKNGTIMRYKVEKDTLHFYTLDAKVLKDAVKAGKVPGVVDENDSASLTELDEATIKWLGEVGNDKGWEEQVYKKTK